MSPTPTTRALAPDDVLGQWRFYVDAAASTVTVDLLAAGRYRETIAANSSRRNAAPDGNGRSIGRIWNSTPTTARRRARPPRPLVFRRLRKRADPIRQG